MKTREVKTDFSTATIRAARCVVCGKNLPENTGYESCFDCAMSLTSATGDDLEYHEDFICGVKGALSLSQSEAH